MSFSKASTGLHYIIGSFLFPFLHLCGYYADYEKVFLIFSVEFILRRSQGTTILMYFLLRSYNKYVSRMWLL